MLKKEQIIRVNTPEKLSEEERKEAERDCKKLLIALSGAIDNVVIERLTCWKIEDVFISLQYERFAKPGCSNKQVHPNETTFVFPEIISHSAMRLIRLCQLKGFEYQAHIEKTGKAITVKKNFLEMIDIWEEFDWYAEEIREQDN